MPAFSAPAPAPGPTSASSSVRRPRLVLTRPQQQAQEWLARLQALGVEALSLPLLAIEGGDGSEARAAWQALPEASLAFFVSPNAVACFFAQRPPQQPWPADCMAACVGPGSAKALAEAGVPPALIVQPPAEAASLDSEHLWPQLSGHDWTGRRVLLLRGEGGRDWLADRLREQGAAPILSFHVYRRCCPVLLPDEQALLAHILAAPQDHVWLFSSAEAIGHLQSLAPTGQDWGRARCLATHMRIAERARALGLGHVVLTRPEAEAVAGALGAMRGDPYNQFHCE